MLAGGGCATIGICGSGKEELQISGSAPSCGASEQISGTSQHPHEGSHRPRFPNLYPAHSRAAVPPRPMETCKSHPVAVPVDTSRASAQGTKPAWSTAGLPTHRAPEGRGPSVCQPQTCAGTSGVPCPGANEEEGIPMACAVVPSITVTSPSPDRKHRGLAVKQELQLSPIQASSQSSILNAR